METICENKYNCEGLLYNKVKHTKANLKFNSFVNSNWLLVIVGVLCLAGYAFLIEPFIYTIYLILAISIVLFAKYPYKTIQIIPFFYVMPGVGSNPGLSAASFLRNIPLMVGLSAVALVYLILLFIIAGKNKVKYKRPYFTIGFLVLGIAYMCSGLFSDTYILKHTVYGLCQIIALTLFYYLVLKIANWNEFPKDMFAKIGIVLGMVVALEVLIVYASGAVFNPGQPIIRRALNVGWGVYNNVGNMLAFCIPSSFYFVLKSKHKTLFLLNSVFVCAVIVATTSRGSIITGAAIFFICLIYTFIKLKDSDFVKRCVIIMTVIAILVVVGIAIAYKYFDEVVASFNKIQEYGAINDSGRFDIWRRGWKAFISSPIFGAGFYECDGNLFDHVGGLIIPARWHNTFIQLLGACGIIGLIAYEVHRAQTIVFFMKNKSDENFLIAASILAILIGTLLDNHFFNFGPGILYGMFLAFAEGLSFRKNCK